MGAVYLSLNAYHQEFLKHLVNKDVRFLVIGGQARAKFENYSAGDLDLWIDISDANVGRYALAHFNSFENYPNHVHPSRAAPTPAAFASTTQVHIPDDDVIVLIEGQPLSLTEENRIDLLFGVRDFDFNYFYDRAVSDKGIH